MDFFKVITKRQSIKKYLPGKTIPDKDINKILEMVSLAPSAKNLQSYKIFVAKDRESIEKLFPCYYNQRSDFIKNAALILIFCQDSKPAEEHFGERGKNLYSLQDATISATYAMLTATAIGYGSCWVGNFKIDEVQKVLKTELIPVASIIIGYPDENISRKKRKPLDLLAEVIN